MVMLFELIDGLFLRLCRAPCGKALANHPDCGFAAPLAERLCLSAQRLTSLRLRRPPNQPYLLKLFINCGLSSPDTFFNVAR